MATLTEMVAVVVVHSSAAALSHFGVALDTPRVERPVSSSAAEQRIVARTPRKMGERVGKPDAGEPIRRPSPAQA